MNRRSILASIIGLALSGPAIFHTPALADSSLKVGVSAGPYGDILREAAKLAEKDGLRVEVIEFSDWNQPNAALDAGEIDLNAFQHKPYLDNQIKARGYKLVALDKAISVPGGIWSAKVKSLADLPEGARLGIPNDPTNATRGLFLFQQAGVIKLDPAAGTNASVLDITENPKNVTFVELDAAQLPRSLDDLDASFVSNNYAHLAGLKREDALITEGTDSVWAIIFAARDDRKNDPNIKKYITLYRSEPIRAFIEQKFEGSILPAF